MTTIPFFNYPSIYRSYEEEYEVAIKQVLSQGKFIMQEELFEFEERLKTYLGVKHAFGVADGTMALYLSMKALGIGSGDEVIVPSHTFAASASAIAHTGATPVLCDSGPDHLIEPTSVKNVISKKTKAIMPVHLNGRTANMDRILEISKEYNLLIIEDACQALGSSYKKTFAGTFGSAGSFSFYPSKTLGSFGDAGAIVANDDDFAEKLVMLRDHGRDESGKVKMWGLNSRLDNLQAAVLLVRFNHYEEEITHRRLLASRYEENLNNLDSIVLPPCPDSSENHYDIFQNYEVEVDDRENLRNFLEDSGIGTILPWAGYCLHDFDDLDLVGEYNNSIEFSKRFMLLPLHASLTLEEVDIISEKILKFYSK